MNCDRRTERPEIVVPDAGPLLYLAQAGALHLLHRIGRRVVLTDMIAHEATADLATPGAPEVAAWLEAGRAPGSDAPVSKTPVSVETTGVGRAFFTACRAEPDFRWRGAGELSLVDWLRDRVDATASPVLIVYENGRVPELVGEAGVDADLDLLTTRAFLEQAERDGLVPSAEAYWRRIAEAAPAANPRVVVTRFRRAAGTAGQDREGADRARHDGALGTNQELTPIAGSRPLHPRC